MDKLKLTNHIKDIDLKNKIFKVIDKANASLKNYDIRYTEFLNPYEMKNAVAVLNSFEDLKYTVDGGYLQAERCIATIYPFYIDSNDLEENIKFIQINGNFKFKEVAHKDYLGALMSLGIKREKIGDIIIHDNFCQVMVDKDICDYIVMNLDKVSRNNVKVSEISRYDIICSIQNYKDIHFTVSSDRLDCIISGLYNVSRQESLKHINGEKVYVNYEKISTPSKLLKADDLISVRGNGRARIIEIGDVTKKGKIKIYAQLIK